MLIFVAGLVIGTVVFFAGGSKTGSGKALLSKKVRIILSLLIVAAGTVISCIRQVPTGNTGVVVTFGRVEDYTLDSGIHMIAPWKSVVNMDNRTQIYTSELSCFSSDIQEVSVMYSVNYRISKDDAQTIYRTIGAGYLQTVMDPKIQEAVKGVTAKYNAEKLVEQRGTLSAQIEEVLKESLTPYNIEVVSTSLANIDFTDAFTNAVEAKQVAEQNKLKAQTEQAQQTLEAQAAAERKVIEAKANADSSIVAAQADAEVAKIAADSAEYQGQKDAAIMSNLGTMLERYPQLVKYYYVTNWDGKMPETMLDDNSNILMNID
jgi:regulator of protease activity HflC (stomatin/prohibitin superfamily)